MFECLPGIGQYEAALISSTLRLITYVIPTLWLSARPGFRAEHIWYLSIATTTMQALLSLWLLHRELGNGWFFHEIDRFITLDRQRTI